MRASPPCGSCNSADGTEAQGLLGLPRISEIDGSAYESWANALVAPVLRGPTVAIANFWASAASSLVCSVSVSSCLREWLVDNSKNSEGDFTLDSSWTNSKAASVLALANSANFLL